MGQNRIEWYLTSKDSANRITRQADLFFSPSPAEYEGKDIVNIYSDVEFQTFMGFGGAFTEASASVYYWLPPEKRAAFLKACFDKAEGNLYTFCRTHMNSCDFSTGHYSCDDVPGDTELAHFNIERDRQQMIPMINEARRYGDFKLFFSTWSPPAWMKSNGSMSGGGKLLPQYRAVWAEFYARFIQSYREHGIDFWGLTVQNEPMAEQTWESCVYTAEEEADFLKHYLVPALRRHGLQDVKILLWDHNKSYMYDRAKIQLSDPEAAEHIWGMGFHWYGGHHFEALNAIHERWPDKNLVYTEGCKENGPSYGAWDVGERYGSEIIGDLNNHTCAWCDWNLLLDFNGGPNHVSNYCDAPILASEDFSDLLFETSYWYIGHFSRFIKPGSVRICHTRMTDRLECTAFRNTDETIALVIMNKHDEAQTFTLHYQNGLCEHRLDGHAIATYCFHA